MHPAEHWLQLRDATDDELVEVADGFLRRRNPLLSHDELVAKVASLAGRPGAARARAALTWVVPGTESLYESRTRLVLVRAGLPQPVVNCPVYVPAIDRELHLDMGYRQEKVGVEYDGAVHVGNQRQMHIDANRRRMLQDQGWMIITVTADQLYQPQHIVHSVESALMLRRAALLTQRGAPVQVPKL